MAVFAGERVEHDRRELARAIHDRVIQRLCGVALALESASELCDGDRVRCRRELGDALAELRSLLAGALPAEPDTSLRELLCEAAADHAALPLAVELPPELEPLHPPSIARHFVDEALRNVARHAHPRRVAVEARMRGAALELSVHNDGALPAVGPRGIGLRLLQAETTACGAALDASPDGAGGWLARLSVPVGGSANRVGPVAAHT